MDKNRTTTIKEKKCTKKIKTFNHSLHDETPHQTYQTRQSRRPPLQTRAGDDNSFRYHEGEEGNRDNDDKNTNRDTDQTQRRMTKHLQKKSYIRMNE